MSTQRRAAWALAGLLALVGLSAPARAEAPMVTEHTDPLAVGECEWEVFSERVRAGGLQARGWSTNAGCGLRKDVDLGLGVGQWRTDGVAERSLELYGRWRLREGGDDGASLALVYGLDALKQPGERLRWDGSTLLLAVDQPLSAAFLGRVNGGVTHSRLDHRTRRVWALGLDWHLGDQLDAVAETYGSQGSKPWQGVGLRWLPADGWSFGVMVSRGRDTPRARGLLFSAQWVH